MRRFFSFLLFALLLSGCDSTGEEPVWYEDIYGTYYWEVEVGLPDDEYFIDSDPYPINPRTPATTGFHTYWYISGAELVIFEDGEMRYTQNDLGYPAFDGVVNPLGITVNRSSISYIAFKMPIESMPQNVIEAYYLTLTVQEDGSLTESNTPRVWRKR